MEEALAAVNDSRKCHAPGRGAPGLDILMHSSTRKVSEGLAWSVVMGRASGLQNPVQSKGSKAEKKCAAVMCRASVAAERCGTSG